MVKRSHRSAQGKLVNFDELISSQPKTVAVGNAGLNARGDKVGRNGEIIKTAEEIAKENQTDVREKKVSVSKDLDDLKKARNQWKEQFVDIDDDESVLDPKEAAKLIRPDAKQEDSAETENAETENAETENTEEDSTSTTAKSSRGRRSTKSSSSRSSTSSKRKIVETDE